jgi:polyisoprenoid-binding protein YceI
MPRWHCACLIACLAAIFISGSAQSADTFYNEKKQPVPGLYKLDKFYTYVRFSVNTLGFKKVPGVFNEIYGQVQYDGKDVRTMKVKAQIIIDALSSGNGMRDKHLKKDPDFFYIKYYTKAFFESTKAEPVSPGIFKLYGNLTIKKFMSPVVLLVHGPISAKSASGYKAFTASATSEVNRKDFRLTGGNFIADNVAISIQAKAVNSPDAEAWEATGDGSAGGGGGGAQTPAGVPVNQPQPGYGLPTGH